MDNKLIDEMEAALRAEYEQRRKDLDAELRKKLDALRYVSGRPTVNIVKVFSRIPPPPKGHTNGSAGTASAVTSPEMPSAKKAAREAIKRMSGNFSVRDLVPVIEQLYPRLGVTTALLANPMWSLKNDGEIEIVTEGEGRQPHIYRKK